MELEIAHIQIIVNHACYFICNPHILFVTSCFLVLYDELPYETLKIHRSECFLEQLLVKISSLHVLRHSNEDFVDLRSHAQR